jgi:hypothetical protein
MNNANDARNTHNSVGIPNDLPPIPPLGATGPDVCETVQLYLAIIDDLTPQQIAQLSEHVVTCAACSEAFETLERATHLVGGLVASEPSTRVDAAISALLERERASQRTKAPDRQPVTANRVPSRRVQRPARRRQPALIAGELVAAAVLLLALFASLHFSGIFGGIGGNGPQTTFTLPSSLSWNGYVLYHNQTRMATNGELYEVTSYHDLGTGNMHVETKMDSQLDVVAVGNSQEMLGMDTIHHVAQMGAEQWSVDDSIFNLNALRHDLQAKQDTYLGTGTFQGQPVYRIRCSNGLVMLLDMHYMPVNVLRGTPGSGTGSPIYTTLKMLPSSQVPASMWNMSIPPGYHMGTLPPPP